MDNQEDGGKAMAGPSSSIVPEEHGDWLIWHAPLPIAWRGGDWHFARKSATDDIDIGVEESREMCLQTIDFIEQSEVEDASPEGQARFERVADKAMQLLAAHGVQRALKNLLDLPGISNLPGFATGVHISSAQDALATFNERYGIPQATPNASPKATAAGGKGA